MNLNRILATGLLIVACSLMAFKIDKDPLHKRKFTGFAQAIDVRDGTPRGKQFVDEIDFKNGRLYSLACWDKMEFQEITYEIKKDSTYKDGEEDKRYFEVLATTTNEKKEHLKIEITINGYNYQATYTLSKKDIPKKKFTCTATEKLKNPKK
jgi:hypothetical protein